MKLDKEQKRILKVIWPISIAYLFGYPLFMWLFGKVDSWADVLWYVLGGLLLQIVLGVFYILGSKIPKKD